jgi:hypothetical protein|tara:strand:- start:320 stop:544 length:225 start_codon:yes stop_codon:yes gene_type:complete
MSISMVVNYENGIAKSLIPGQSFLHKEEMYIALNRTDMGYLVRKIDDDQGIILDKDTKIYIVKSLKKRVCLGDL